VKPLEQSGTAASRVLILDDESDIRESLGGFLDDCGFSVLTAGSAEEALALDLLAEVGVAVVDIRLGGMDGLGFIRLVHAERPWIRFLIHTGSTEFRLDDELRALGMTEEDVLYKPVADIGMFEAAIRARLAGGAA
jgi:DNA-binding response OmpR family regulator